MKVVGLTREEIATHTQDSGGAEPLIIGGKKKEEEEKCFFYFRLLPFLSPIWKFLFVLAHSRFFPNMYTRVFFP